MLNQLKTLINVLLKPYRITKRFYEIISSQKLTNDQQLKKLLEYFQADVYGHQANIATADLGYGFIHYGLLRQLKPKTVLCIGSRYGFIPAVLASACKDNGFGQVYFVDAGLDDTNSGAYTGKGFWRKPEGMKIFEKFGLGGFITIFVTKTKSFAKLYPDLVFDYIYVDGDHSYRGAKFDFMTFWPRLLPNGLMAFHDSSIKERLIEGDYGVWRVLKAELKKRAAVVFPSLTAGLTLIQKPVSLRSK